MLNRSLLKKLYESYKKKEYKVTDEDLLLKDL